MLVGGRVPWSDRTVADRLVGIRNHQIQVELDDIAKAFARGAGAERTVEAQPPRLRLSELPATGEAFQAAGKIEALPRATVDRHSTAGQACNGTGVLLNQGDGPPLALLKRGFQGIAESLLRRLAGRKAINHHE